MAEQRYLIKDEEENIVSTYTMRGVKGFIKRLFKNNMHYLNEELTLQEMIPAVSLLSRFEIAARPDSGEYAEFYPLANLLTVKVTTFESRRKK